MSNQERSEKADDSEEPLAFELSEDDLEAIAQAKSKVVPNLPKIGNSAFTIENAPVAKAIMPADFFSPAEPIDPEQPTSQVEGDDEGHDEPG